MILTSPLARAGMYFFPPTLPGREQVHPPGPQGHSYYPSTSSVEGHSPFVNSVGNCVVGSDDVALPSRTITPRIFLSDATIGVTSTEWCVGSSRDFVPRTLLLLPVLVAPIYAATMALGYLSAGLFCRRVDSSDFLACVMPLVPIEPTLFSRRQRYAARTTAPHKPPTRITSTGLRTVGALGSVRSFTANTAVMSTIKLTVTVLKNVETLRA